MEEKLKKNAVDKTIQNCKQGLQEMSLVKKFGLFKNIKSG